MNCASSLPAWMKMPMMSIKKSETGRRLHVLLGMSGGVDSSVALFLLQKQGFSVTGLTLITSDAGLDNMEDARAVCDQAGAAHVVADVRKEFAATVVEDFISGYLQGRTPNPCILCNPTIKFSTLLQEADRLGCEYVATGHYARISPYLPTGRLSLTRSGAGIKDQTYFLYRLSQTQLSRIIFPLADLVKDETKKIAAELGVKSADGENMELRKESQDNCFIGAEGYAEYIRQQLEKRDDREALRLLEPGPVLDVSGREIGRHSGLINYTVGQRRGINVRTSERLFVLGKVAKKNALVVGAYEHVLQDTIKVIEPVYSGLKKIDPETQLDARIRYSARAVPCLVTALGDGSLSVRFTAPAAAPAPGQSCVFYRGDQVMAGGYIAFPEMALRAR